MTINSVSHRCVGQILKTIAIIDSNQRDKLKVEFVKFIHSHETIREEFERSPNSLVYIELGLFPRDVKLLKRQYSTSHVASMRHATISQSKKLIRQLGDERVLDSPVQRKAIIHRPSLVTLIETDSLSGSIEEGESGNEISPKKSKSGPLMGLKSLELETEDSRERSSSVSSTGSDRTGGTKIDKAERSFRMVRNIRKRSGSFTETLSMIDEEPKYDGEADDESSKKEVVRTRKIVEHKKKKKALDDCDKKRRKPRSRKSSPPESEDESPYNESSGDEFRTVTFKTRTPNLSTVNLGKSEPLLFDRTARSANSSPRRVRIKLPESPTLIKEELPDAFIDAPDTQDMYGNNVRNRVSSLAQQSKNRINIFESLIDNRYLRSGSLTMEDAKITGDDSALSVKSRSKLSTELSENKSWVPIMKPCQGFWVEVGDIRLTEEDVLKYDPMIENEGDDMLWYLNHFAKNKDHQNYIAMDTQGNPIIISTVREKRFVKEDCVEKRIRVLQRSKKQDERFLLNEKQFLKTKLKKLKGVQITDILKYTQAYSDYILDGKIRTIKDPAVIPALCKFETANLNTRCKFGILLCKEGQTTEEEMFSNEFGSEYFDQFLDLLGERVPLKGFQGFKGGLDIERDATGTHSIYTRWRDRYEIMFHVSTMLPFSTDNPQQLERKRHLGNDIVVIIFKEGNTPYIPNTISSEFNHVIVVVQPEFVGDKVMYRLAVGSKDGVPTFGPTLPSNPIFEVGDQLRDLLICKLVNAEKAALKSPKFQTKVRRTREVMLKEMVDTFWQ